MTQWWMALFITLWLGNSAHAQFEEKLKVLTQKLETTLRSQEPEKARLQSALNFHADLVNLRKQSFAVPLPQRQVPSYEKLSLLINSLESWVDVPHDFFECEAANRSISFAWVPRGDLPKDVPWGVSEAFRVLSWVCRNPVFSKPIARDLDL
jgi:hypothetical protein